MLIIGVSFPISTNQLAYLKITGYNSTRMTKKKKPSQNPPDGRGKRPKDPNAFAAWLVEQTTSTSQSNESKPPDKSKK
jgi:hypothetical protein